MENDFEIQEDINQQMDGQPEQNKALSWLILALNQQDELYYCFQLIFTNGSFLMYYNEDTSYLFRNRD